MIYTKINYSSLLRQKASKLGLYVEKTIITIKGYNPSPIKNSPDDAINPETGTKKQIKAHKEDLKTKTILTGDAKGFISLLKDPNSHLEAFGYVVKDNIATIINETIFDLSNMYDELLDPTIINKINELRIRLIPFNGKHGKDMTEHENQRLKGLRDEINKEIQQKSGKPERLFVIVLSFYKKTRVFRVQCAFTSLDKLKKYYPDRYIHYGVDNDDGIDDSVLSVNLCDL